MDKNKDNGTPPMWNRQILHVWVRNMEEADIVSKVVEEQPHKIVVVISIAIGSDFIFTNKIKNPPKLPIIHLEHIKRYVNESSRAKLKRVAYL